MPLSFTCSCGRTLRVKDDWAGKKVRCPDCREIARVPADSDEDDDSVHVVAKETPRAKKRRPEPEDESDDFEDREAPRPKKRRPEPEPESESEEEPVRDEPVRPPPKLRKLPSQRTSRRDKPRRASRDDSRRTPLVAFEPGWFGSMNAGVVGGILMILIAAVWFVLGLMNDIIFFYPPILAIIGVAAIIKGLMGSN